MNLHYPVNIIAIMKNSGTIFLSVIPLVAITILSILYLLAFSRIFKKAGRNRWLTLIPVYNGWVLFEIAGYPGALVLLSFLAQFAELLNPSNKPNLYVIYAILLIPSIVAYVLMSLRLAKKFGKGPLFAILGLIIFSIVGYPILAFGKATYTKAEDQN